MPREVYQSLLFLMLSTAIAVQAQVDAAKWIRVQSDDGQFSAEFPDEYSYFFDKEGFSLTRQSRGYELRDVSLLNSFREGTLLTVEAYNSPRGAVDALIDTTTTFQVGHQSSAQLNGIPAERVELRNNDTYLVTYYLRSEDRIFVVTAASRTGETSAMKRFLDSVRLNPAAQGPSESAEKFSSLTLTPVDVKTRDMTATPAPPREPLAQKDPEPGVKPIILLTKPRASYTEVARNAKVQGSVRLKMEFSKKGHISSVEVVKTLPQGLLRQSLFAALRTKFLPKEKEGEPLNVILTIEYTFKVY